MKNQRHSFKIFLIIYFTVILIGVFYFIKYRTLGVNNLTRGESLLSGKQPTSSYFIPTESDNILKNLATHLDLKNEPNISSSWTFAPGGWDVWITTDLNGNYKYESLKGAVLITSSYDQLEMEGVGIYRKPINELDTFKKMRSFFEMNEFTENPILRTEVKIEDTIIESLSGYYKDDIKCLVKIRGEFWEEKSIALFLCGLVEEDITKEIIRTFPGSQPPVPLSSILNIRKFENDSAAFFEWDVEVRARKKDGSWRYHNSFGGVEPFR